MASFCGGVHHKKYNAERQMVMKNRKTSAYQKNHITKNLNKIEGLQRISKTLIAR